MTDNKALVDRLLTMADSDMVPMENAMNLLREAAAALTSQADKPAPGRNRDAPTAIKPTPPPNPPAPGFVTPQADGGAKCLDCFGDGKRCLAGHSAHRDNWFTCETCKGTGKAHPAPAPDVARLVEEYRPTMDSEVLHSWAQDVVRAFTAAQQKGVTNGQE